MEKYLLLTKYNKQKSAELKNAHDLIAIGATVVEEYFETSLNIPGGRKIPNLIAVYNNEVIFETDNPQEFASFNANAQAALEALLE